MRAYFFIILLSVGIWACSADTDLSANAGTDIELIADSIQFNDILAHSISDTFTIDTAYIAFDWLFCTVTYPGGCAQHTFQAYWNQSISTKSEIPVLEIILTHNANSDSCEAYISQELSINLQLLTGGKFMEYSPLNYHIINNSNNQVYTITN